MRDLKKGIHCLSHGRLQAARDAPAMTDNKRVARGDEYPKTGQTKKLAFPPALGYTPADCILLGLFRKFLAVSAANYRLILCN
jgi:hypothetical protein